MNLDSYIEKEQPLQSLFSSPSLSLGIDFRAKLNKILIICLFYVQVYRRSVHIQDGARFSDGRCPGE
jgi:hypothetical protein